VKKMAARSALVGALLLLTGCSVSIAREPFSDAPAPLAETSPAPPIPQAPPPTDILTAEKPASECNGLAATPCKSQKAEAEGTRATVTQQGSTAVRKAEIHRKAEAKRKTAEKRKVTAAAVQRLAEGRKAQEDRLADAARVARDAEKKRLADKFKLDFERGRSTWLSAQ
jgi:hypothetical protein